MGVLAINGGSQVRTKPFFGGKALIGDEERRRVNEVLDSGTLSGFIGRAGDHFLGGKQVKEFEGLVKDYFGVSHVIAMNSATAGLHTALAACGVTYGDEVIVPPYTMCASATAIVISNGIPVFADISEDNFSIDPKSIRARITPRTKGIVVVHLFGGAAHMDEIMAIAREHNLFVVEDCAQSPGATYKGKYVGTFGDVGVFSLNQHKTITCGEGGFAITNNEKLALRMQLIRNHGEVVVKDIAIDDISNIVGYNYRMTELEAAVSYGQFLNLDRWNDLRREMADHLSAQLSKYPSLICPPIGGDVKHVYFVYAIRFDAKALGISRETFVNAIDAEGIPCGAAYVQPIYLEPMYQQRIAHGSKGYPFAAPEYKGSVNYSKGICPVCERMYEEDLVLLPVCNFPNTIADMDDVIKAFDKVIANLDELKSNEIAAKK